MAPGESAPNISQPVLSYAEAQKAETMAMHRTRVDLDTPLEGRVSSPLNMVGGMALLKEVVMPQQTTDMDEEWRKSAKCKGAPDINFFFPHGSRGSDEAQKFCDGCPVKQTCLEYAIEVREDHGVWGGTSQRDRTKIRRNRKKLHMNNS